MSKAAYIVCGVRTPIGRIGGALSQVRADDLAAHVITQLVIKTGIPKEQVEDVIFGCANQAGEDNRNVGRMAALLSGLPVSVPGVTVNRLCGSGMQAVADGCRQIQLGDAELIVAGGVEQMSRSPWVMAKPATGFARGDATMHDTTLGWRFVNPKMEAMHGTLPLGQTAEKVAELKHVSREAQDQLAARSQTNAGRAISNGRLAQEIVAISVPGTKKGETISVSVDEHPRPETSLENLQKLSPAFKKEGTVTAGNSSGLNDGACALLLASEDAVKKYGLTPWARFVTCTVAGVEPSLMGLGPIPATRRAFAKTGISSAQIDVCELNEAFAAQAVPCISELELNPDLVNVNGGAIALGHPLGMSGARMVLTLAKELSLRPASKYGLASMCIGVGQGISTIIERA